MRRIVGQADEVPATDPLRDASRGERLQKVLAASGVASRRACEELIAEGAVRVNGRIVRDLPAWVDPALDRIEVRGRLVAQPESPVYVMLYKPEAVLCTTEDPGGRRTVASLVDHPGAARLYPVGRLDYDASGLVLMTNDGDLTRALTRAATPVARVYEVTVKGLVDEAEAAELERRMSKAKPRPRIHADDVARGKQPARKPRKPGRAEIRILSQSGAKSVLEITLPEGPNREVTNVLLEADRPVRKVTLVGLGPLRLSGLQIGQWRELTRDEVRAIRLVARGKAPKVSADHAPESRGKRRKPTLRSDRNPSAPPASRSGRSPKGPRPPRRGS